MTIELKPFLNMLRRATRCGFSSVLLNNRMLMQCYNLDVDSEVGLHYVLHIPDDQDPLCDFYNLTLLLKPREILKVYSEGHKALDAERKEQKLTPKAASEVLEYHEHKHHIDLEFHFYLAGEEFQTQEYSIPYPVDESIPEVENCVKAYDQLLDRIKHGGACLAFNGTRMDLQRRIVECPEIYRYQIRYHGKKLSIPFTKSMFLGIKELDRFFFSVQETTMDDIYVYSISLEKKGIIEQFWGYLLQY